MTTLDEAFATAVAALRAAGVTSPEVDARWLVEAATGVDPRRADPRRADGRVLTSAESAALAAMVARRCAREPLQLVLGTVVFRGIELRCRPGVFIPRPETEVLAQHAIDLVRDARAERAPVVVHEPCCGTGAVGLAIASEVAGAVVHLGDRSEAAVTLATENRDALAAAGRARSPVEVHRGHLLEPFARAAAPDLIVANPPYLPTAELAGLDPEVVDHDPHDALAGGPDGHEVVDALLAASARRLVPGGAVVLEIDARRAGEVADTAEREGLVDVTILRDLTGAERFVRARRPGHGPARG